MKIHFLTIALAGCTALLFYTSIKWLQSDFKEARAQIERESFHSVVRPNP